MLTQADERPVIEPITVTVKQFCGISNLSKESIYKLIRAELAHIDLMLAQHDRVRQEMLHDETRIDRVRQEMRLAPWAIVSTSMAAGAALFAAAFALAKLYQ